MLIVHKRNVIGAALVALLALSAAYFEFTSEGLPNVSMERVDAARLSSILPTGSMSGLPAIPSPERERLASTALNPLVNGQFIALIEQTFAHSRSTDRVQAMIEAKASLLEEIPPHLQARALDLLRRYVDYGEDSMTLPAAELGNLNAAQHARDV